MEDKIKELRERWLEIGDLYMASSVLSWDRATYMPAGGAEARGRQMALLRRLAHERQVAPEMGRLLEELAPFEESLPYDSDEASLIRVSRRDFEKEVKVPPAFIAEATAHSTASYQAWVKARPENDFAAVQPFLEKSLDLSRRYANFFPGYDHIADPLIDRADQGMKAHTIQALFAELREQLVPLLKKIQEQPEADDSCLHKLYPEEKQLAFGRKIIERYGYDFARGRLDKTAHPFATMFSVNDVRITTRVDERDLGQALFSTLHESGHAMYQLGVNQAYEGTPLVRGASAGVHESQSRLWENLVGRSRPFWGHYYPRLKETFPDQLGDVSLGTFYKAINKVTPSLIRVEADEVTYNLHVMIRFDLELAMLEGRLAIKDLPEAWHARYEEDLGLRAPDDRDGVLQDVHWFGFSYIGGAFQGYSLGNIMSALFFELALEQRPKTTDQMAEGRFDALHDWLKENIYQHGSKYTPDELVQRISGRPLTIEPYMRYLRTK
ncbi:MAG: carboxypeptidase M32, partial [Chloroflexota bacterium]